MTFAANKMSVYSWCVLQWYRQFCSCCTFAACWEDLTHVPFHQFSYDQDVAGNGQSLRAKVDCRILSVHFNIDRRYIPCKRLLRISMFQFESRDFSTHWMIWKRAVYNFTHWRWPWIGTRQVCLQSASENFQIRG